MLQKIYNQLFGSWKSSLVGLITVLVLALQAFIKGNEGSPFDKKYFISLFGSLAMAAWLFLKTDVSQAIQVIVTDQTGDATTIITDPSTNVSAAIQGSVTATLPPVQPDPEPIPVAVPEPDPVPVAAPSIYVQPATPAPVVPASIGGLMTPDELLALKTLLMKL